MPLDEQEANLIAEVAGLTKRIDGMIAVDRERSRGVDRRIDLLERVVYGGVGIIVVTVLGALVALVVRTPAGV